MTEFIKKHTLVFGTLLLTTTGLLSRVLGFFYRIFLSRTIGAEGLGIYQMVFPVYGICLSLCAGSIQTAISRFTAANHSRARKILLTGFTISFSLSLLLSAIIWSQAEFLAVHILLEPRCAPLLPVLALAIPCTSVHACISGYYYGKEKVQVPAIAQLVEQCIRIFTVFLVSDIFRSQGQELTVKIAVIGLVAGEAGSALFSLIMFMISTPEKNISIRPSHEKMFSTALPLMTLAVPLMANRLVMNVLQSAEAILIPNRLADYGLTTSQAVSIYGVLTGMAMPFIMFPSAIVNSLAVVLLPTVARHQSSGNDTGLAKSISMSFRYSLYMGILCIGIFTVFGESLGLAVFNNQDAGTFISILAWLCPFLYLATTIGSILNGLGKTTVTFLHNFISLLIRLIFVYFGIPKMGINACLWGMLLGEILLALLHLNTLRKSISFSPNAWEVIVKPAFCLFISLGIHRLLPESIPLPSSIPQFFSTAIQIAFVCVIYALMLLLLHIPETRKQNSDALF